MAQHSPLIEVVDVGITFDDDGEAYPTVVLDVSARPDVADLPRVHAIDGIGDITTHIAPAGDDLVLTVVLSTPVRAELSVRFTLPDHAEVLAHAAIAGHLLFATTTPNHDGANPAWLAVDIDGPSLVSVLAGLIE